MNNLTWARLIIQQLLEQGVHHFCLAPGSRSTPLAVALAEEKDAAYTTHFDERGLGFYALGLSKGCDRPVGIIVTSGTAVGNLMPAVMEAWHDHVPLILLTADRPPELRDCGANQTTDQVKIFTSFVHFQVDLSCPFSGGERYLASTMGYGVHVALKQGRGPVHFNCMFREPLLGATEALPTVTPTRYCQDSLSTNTSTTETLAAAISQHEHGVIVCGQRTDSSSSTAALELAEHLQWPLLADISSGLRGNPSPAAIPYYDFLLKGECDLKPTAILHCGGRLVSRTLMEWCHKAGAPLYVHIDDRPSRLDPQHAFTHHFQVDAQELCAKLAQHIPQKSSWPWLSEWQQRAALVTESIQTLLPSIESCTEPGLIHTLREHIHSDVALFLANSMPVRDANLFLFREAAMGPVFTNRGLSGIDGNIATVAGLAEGLAKPTIAIIGDLAALHDLNSFALIRKARVPILLIVINNSGAGIFSFLPHLAKAPNFEELFAHHHDWEFARAAAMFSIPYQAPPSMCDLDTAIKDFCNQPSTCVLELRTERKANHELHQVIDAKVAESLSHRLTSSVSLT